jgi:two-component system NtrC family response regulator
MESVGRAVELIGEHPLIRRLNELFRRLGTVADPVLLIGESGTGKRAAARAIHDASTRVAAPFVPVECAGVRADLLEAELFGTEQDSFAGGIRARSGKIHRAAGGTIFLHEIGDLSLPLQERLLSWLGRRKDIRLIAATRRDLAAERERGLLRPDLFELLQRIPITLPTLRERRSDVPILVRHLLARNGERRGRRLTVSEAAMIHLWEYDWPGNVDELASLLETVSARSADGPIEVDHLPPIIRSFMASKKVRLSRAPAFPAVPPIAMPPPGAERGS